MIFIHGGIHKFYGAFLECTEYLAECLQLKLRMSALGEIEWQKCAEFSRLSIN